MSFTSYALLFHFLDLLGGHVQITNLRPDWKSINLELTDEERKANAPGTNSD